MQDTPSNPKPGRSSSDENRRIACFISPHGYGHAARSCAILEAIQERDSSIQLDIFTRVPKWFFEESLPGAFTYHDLLTDIGLVQDTPLHENLSETLARLDQFIPFEKRLLTGLAKQLAHLQCRLVICDISPLGIAAAREAGIPSILVENFTWDWIYEPYAEADGRFKKHIRFLHEIFTQADFHIQTLPVCRESDNADLKTSPVSRKPKHSASQVRKELGIPEHAKTVLITMGGIENDFQTHKWQVLLPEEVFFIIPGGHSACRRVGNFVLLPHHSQFFHPDLVSASDLVIGKAGYSTLAETYLAGLPFGYFSRPTFREAQILEDFIQKEMSGIRIHESDFRSGDIAPLLSELLALPRIQRSGCNGSDQAAVFILQQLAPQKRFK